MALCSAVIESALKKLGVSEPTTDEISDGLPYLQGLYDRLVTSGALGRATDVRVTADYEAREFDRVFVDTASSVSVTLPEAYDREVTDPTPHAYEPDEEERPVRDLAFIVVTALDAPNDREVFLRDSWYGAWINVQSLETSSEAPLSGRDFNGLACELATLLADEYSDRPPNPLTIEHARRFRASLATNAGSPAFETQGVYF